MQIKNNIVSTVGKYPLNEKHTVSYFWVVSDGVIPERNADGEIRDCQGFFQMNNSNKPYDTYDEAYNAMIRTFKRKKLI